jgi:hypothetical protein
MVNGFIKKGKMYFKKGERIYYTFRSKACVCHFFTRCSTFVAFYNLKVALANLLRCLWLWLVSALISLVFPYLNEIDKLTFWSTFKYGIFTSNSPHACLWLWESPGRSSLLPKNMFTVWLCKSPRSVWGYNSSFNIRNQSHCDARHLHQTLVLLQISYKSIRNSIFFFF